MSTYNLIKKIKRAESKNLNVWVVYHFKEEEENSLNQAGKDDLIDLVRKRAESVSVVELQKEAMRKGISVDMLEQILGVMEMRGEIHLMDGMVIPRQMKLINAPCV